MLNTATLLPSPPTLPPPVEPGSTGGSPLTGESLPAIPEAPSPSEGTSARAALTAHLIDLLKAGNVTEFNRLRPDIGLDLTGIDLAGRSLRGVNFSRCNLTRANLKGCDLEDADFSSSSTVLVRADLSNTILTRAKFEYANLSYASLCNVVRADGADFVAAKLIRADLTAGNFIDADFSHAVLAYATLSKGNFTRANFSEAILAAVLVNDTIFRKANFAKAVLSAAIGDNVDFTEANLVGAKCFRANLATPRKKGDEKQPTTTSYKGAWVRDFEHDGMGAEGDLLAESIADRYPPEGMFPVREKPEEKALLIDGIPGSNLQLFESTMKQLEELVGLVEVKRVIKEQLSLMRFQHAREQRGLPKADMNYHFVFTGSPGTGKTTVARLMSQLLHATGFLKKGHLVEAPKNELIAGFQGQTAIKTAEKINEAIDGTLFIDEAYSLTQNTQDEYSRDSIATIVKMMEDLKGRISVIAAGYTKEMETFVSANSGLKSRFTVFIDFPDYSNAELVTIMRRMFDGKGFTYDARFLAAASFLLAVHREREGKSFANAREVRNIVQETVTQLARRVEGKYGEPGALTQLQAEDLPFQKFTGQPYSGVHWNEITWEGKEPGASAHIADLTLNGQFPEPTSTTLEIAKGVAQYAKLAKLESAEQDLDDLESRVKKG